jgi:uncharacterized RDD family membrane protein YckC
LFKVSENEVAPIEKRVFAFIIDELFIYSLFLLIFFGDILSIKSYVELESFLNRNLALLFILEIIYHTFFIGSSGVTLGKHLKKIKVVNINTGNSIGYFDAFRRSGFRFVSKILFLIGFFLVFITPLKQAFHDHATDAVVIND